MPKLSLKELIAARNTATAERELASTGPIINITENTTPEGREIALDPINPNQTISTESNETFSLTIQLNSQQILAQRYAAANKSFCIIGAAGTGKTTAQREVARSLLRSASLTECSYKVQGQPIRVTAPSIAFCAYTRRAAGNLARAIHKDEELQEILQYNIMTIHALLEYQPVTYWDEDEQKEKFRFEPQRTAAKPLDITHLVIEEASMLGLDLWEKLFDALRPGIQIIFIGDINQLRPVFGPSVLNSALVKLPIIELTEVYRQKSGSLVLENAHRILAGQMVETGPTFHIIQGNSPIHTGQHRQSLALAKWFERLYQERIYDPEQDIILSPFNKQELGTDNMNKWISQILGTDRNAKVFEVIAGFNKHYLAVGDKVMCNKMDGVIVEIVGNGNYVGIPAQPPGTNLSRFGLRIGGHHEDDDPFETGLLGYDQIQLEDVAVRKQQSSHLVRVELESGEVVELNQAGQFTPQIFSLGYCLTVHKAQGCEFRKVFFILHKAHAIMACRELLYTAVTRAKEECYLIAKEETILKAIQTQRIKGDSLADKLEYFNSGLTEQLVEVTK